MEGTAGFTPIYLPKAEAQAEYDDHVVRSQREAFERWWEIRCKFTKEDPGDLAESG